MAAVIQSQSNKDELARIQRQHRRTQLLAKLGLTIVSGIIVLIFFFPIFYWARLSIVPYRETFVIPPRVDFASTTTAWWTVVTGGRQYRDVILEQAGANAGVGGAGTSGYDIRPRIVNSLFIGISSTAVVIV
ncbi:MAG: hypothetical protein K8I60_13005, partial [Anaerolineae bacterium]|nr:hypothetical protein [Anaerolineae bacterium]